MTRKRLCLKKLLAAPDRMRAVPPRTRSLFTGRALFYNEAGWIKQACVWKRGDGG